MYHILVNTSECERRGVFGDREKLPDGNTVISVGDLRFIRFSLGDCKIFNDEDFASYKSSITTNEKKEE